MMRKLYPSVSLSTNYFVRTAVGPKRGNLQSLAVRLVMILLLGGVSGKGWGQTATDGDYRSRATGSWSGTTTWQVRASSSWSNTTTAPSATSNVYIQTGHTVTVDVTTGTVNDLHVHTGGVLAIGTNTVQVNGKIRAYTGSAVTTTGADGTFYSGQTSSTNPGGNSITTGTGGKVSFVGNTRSITVSGEWGATLTGGEVAINLTSGQTGTINTNSKAKNWTITSGTVVMGTNTMSADDGTTGGNITIASGAALTTAVTGTSNNVFQRTGNAPIGTLTVAGTLMFSGAAPHVQVTSFDLANGTVVYSGNSQTFSTNGNGTTPGSIPLIYGNITLSGSGTKTTVASQTTTINGTLSMQGTAAYATGTSATLVYGAASTLEYASSSSNQTTTSTEFPASGGPASLKINNTFGSTGVTLHAARTLGTSSTGVLTLTSGLLVTTSTNSLTLANTAVGAISGGSTTSYVSGPLKRTLPASLAASSNVYAFPVGKGGVYYPLSINSVTSGATTPVLTFEAFNAGSGGSAGTGLSAISSAEYWQGTIASGNFTSGSVSLTRQAALSTLDVIGNNSSSATGAYSNVNGTVSGTSINNSDIVSNLGFFVLAAKTTGSSTPPTLSAAVGATVDAAFNVTFTDDPTWRAAITGITVGGTTLATGAYSTTTAGQITFTPSASTLLQSAGSKSIVVSATGYTTASVTQTIGAGAANKLSVTTQPAAPASNGAVLATQPVVAIQDQYGNTTTSTASITAAVGAGTWTVGGTTSVAAVSGTTTFTNLTATSAAAVTGATIAFTSSGLTGATSGTFNIPAPAPPTLTAAAGATVDAPFNITFPDNPSWRGAITGITVGGTTLTAGYAVSVGQITFTPSLSAPATLLQSSGTKSIVVSANGYTTSSVSQTIGAGAANKLSVTTQPAAPASNGALLATQPVVAIQDQYGNTTTSTASITAAVGAGTWTIGGTTSVAAVGGTTTFTNLTATSAAAVTGATIAFSSSGLTGATSGTFNIPAPAPANDLCSNATAITIGATAVNGTLTAATNTSGNSFTYSSAKNDVWYSFTPTCTGSHTITITYSGISSTFDIDFDVFTSSCPTSGTAPITAHGTSTTIETISTSLNSGTTYYIRVIDYYNYNNSPFTIGITGPSPVTQTVTTSAATLITGTSATLNGNVTALGVCPSTSEKGFVYSLTATNADPLVAGTGVTKTSVAGLTTGAYNLAISTLTANSGYSFKAYVYDGTTYIYGAVTTFTTLAPTPTAASAVTLTGKTTSSISLSWTNGNGAGRIVVARLTSTTNVAAVSGTDYTVNSADFTDAGNGITSTGNVVVYKGTGNAVTVTGLAAGTGYSFYVYEYNGSSTSISYATATNLLSQYTLSLEPVAHPASFTATTTSSTSITLAFSTANSITNGSRYLILHRAGAAVVSTPTDGQAYTTGTTIGTDTVAALVTSATAVSQVISSLSAGAAHYFSIIPYNWDGTNAGTINYYIDPTIKTASATTPSGSSDIVAVTGSESASVSSIENTATIATSTQGTQVWQFRLRDGGVSNDADALPTIFNTLQFTVGTGNLINDYSKAIQSIALFNGTTLISNTATIAATTITFSGLTLSVPDNDSLTITVRLSVKANVNAGIASSTASDNIDGDVFAFRLTASNQAVASVITSSQLLSSFSPAVLSGSTSNAYTVNATTLAFVVQPTDVQTATTVAPNVTVRGLDAGGNLDLSANSITLASTNAAVTISAGATVAASTSTGIATFSGLQFSAAGTTTLTGSSTINAATVTTGAASSSFTVTAAPVSIAYWNFTTANASGVPANLAVSAITQGNNNGTTPLLDNTSPSSGYTGSTGNNNGGAAARTGVLSTGASGSAYFEFTLSPSTGYKSKITGLSFGSRSTGTGPASYTLRSNLDSYGSDIATGSLSGGTTWTLYSNTSLNSASGDGTAIIYRIYGYAGAGSPGTNTANWRIDDLNLFGTVEATCTAPSISVAAAPTSQSVCANATPTDIAITAAGTSPTYQWYSNTTNSNSGGAAVTTGTGGTTATYTPATTTPGTTYYYAVVTACTTTATSAAVAVTVNAAPGITSITPSAQTICLNSTPTDLSVAATGAGLGYQWYSNTTNSNTGGSTIGGATSATYTPATNAAGTVYYYNTVTGTCTPAVTSAAVSVTTTATATGSWIGGTSTDITTGANWCGGLPTASSDVTVGTGTTYSPVIGSSATLTVNNLTVASGATLTVSGTLEVKGAIANNGTLTNTAGTLLLSGSAAQTLAGAAFTGYTIKNLTINNSAGVTLSDSLNITGILTPTGGAFATGGHLTLKSTSILNTAMVGVVGAGASVTGSVTAERFIPRYSSVNGAGTGSKAYRDMAPGVLTTQTAFESWQEGGVTTNGYGTHITGHVGIPGTIDSATGGTGFDNTNSGNVSMYSYNVPSSVNANGNWDAITGTMGTNVLSPFKGYRISIRGSRAHNLGVDIPQMSSTVNLRSKGQLITGTVTYTTTGVTATPGSTSAIKLASNANGYTMIGNPYLSALDWVTIAANTGNASITGSYIIFDPNVNTTGGYVTVNSFGVSSNPSGSQANQYIQPGQAFFVQNVAGGGTQFVIREVDKHAVQDAATLTNVFGANSPLPGLNFVLLKSYNGGFINADGAVSKFGSSFSKGAAREDAKKLTNNTDNLSVLISGNTYSIDGRPEPLHNDSINLRLANLTTGLGYKLSIDLADYTSGAMDAYLVDNYLGAQTMLFKGSVTEYAFTPTSAAASYSNRFTIKFQSVTILPIGFATVTANRNADKTNTVAWYVNEKDADHYEVEYSVDRQNFTTAGTVKATGTAGTLNSYSFIHPYSREGVVYYRIKGTDKSGAVAYSQVVTVTSSGTQDLPAVSIWPNPVKNRTAGISLSAIAKGGYEVAVYNNIGQRVYSSHLVHDGITKLYPVKLPSQVAAGVYELKITGQAGTYYQKMVIE